MNILDLIFSKGHKVLKGWNKALNQCGGKLEQEVPCPFTGSANELLINVTLRHYLQETLCEIVEARVRDVVAEPKRILLYRRTLEKFRRDLPKEVRLFLKDLWELHLQKQSGCRFSKFLLGNLGYLRHRGGLEVLLKESLRASNFSVEFGFFAHPGFWSSELTSLAGIWLIDAFVVPNRVDFARSLVTGRDLLRDTWAVTPIGSFLIKRRVFNADEYLPSDQECRSQLNWYLENLCSVSHRIPGVVDSINGSLEGWRRFRNFISNGLKPFIDCSFSQEKLAQSLICYLGYQDWEDINSSPNSSMFLFILPENALITLNTVPWVLLSEV
ncbi:MAG: hypothetical protein NZT61_05055 [Deltaproteobacteria bacterium]|nr:hypothetical protein [Deltaproteobacteria bacterium]